MRGLAAIFVALGLLLSGCSDADDERALRNPQGAVGVLAGTGQYSFNGQPMDLMQLKAELKTFADDHRHEGLNNSRVRIRITTAAEADWTRTTELIDYCAGIGVDKVEATGR